MTIIRPDARHPILKHGQGSHDEEDHGNWADGLDVEVSEEETAYRGSHQPGGTYGAPAHDLTVLVNEDIYQHPEWYFSMDESYNLEGARVIQRIRGRPDADVKIYRAIPADIEDDINAGDWITTVRSYADQHGESNIQQYEEQSNINPETGRWQDPWVPIGPGYKILTATVKAKELMWPGDSMVEFGWFPDNPFATGEAETLEDLERFSKHGQGSHDDETHGNWADGIPEDERAPGGHGADTLNPAKGKKKGVLEDGRLRRGRSGEGPSPEHTIYLTPDQDYALDPETITQFPSVGSHVIKQGLREKLLLARVGDYGSSPMQLRNNLQQLLNDADRMYEDLNTKGATGKWSEGLKTQPGWIRQADGKIVAEYRDSYHNLIEEDGDRWRWRADAGSVLRDRDRFYASWHEKFFQVSETTGEDFGQIVAAAAVTSPGLDAVSNFQLASYLAEISRSDAVITDDHRAAFREKLDEYTEMLRSPVTPEGIEKRGELHASHIAKADDFEQRAQIIDQVTTWSEITDPMVQARMAWAVKKARDGVGFPVGRTWDNVEKALDILQERSTIDDALGGTQGIKVRSFYNNIIDPNNTSGEDHVTIDFQTVDAAFGMVGSDAITDVTSSGAYLGVGFGSRPFVADAVRSLTYGKDTQDLTTKWGITNSSEMQEVLWAAWKRRLDTKDIDSFFDKLGKKRLSKPSGVIETRRSRTPAQEAELLEKLTVEQAEVLRLGGITQVAKALTQTGMLAPWSFQIDTDVEDPSDEWEAQLYTEDDGQMLLQTREATHKPLVDTANRELNQALNQFEKGAFSGDTSGRRRHLAEQIRRLKRKRKYQKPVPRFGRTKADRSTFGKHRPGGVDHDQTSHGNWAQGFHGTSFKAARSILVEGFELDFAGQGLGTAWGEGLYLTSSEEMADYWAGILYSRTWGLDDIENVAPFILEVEIPDDLQIFRFVDVNNGPPSPANWEDWIETFATKNNTEAVKVMEAARSMWNKGTDLITTHLPMVNFGNMLASVLAARGYHAMEVVPLSEQDMDSWGFMRSGGHQLVIFNEEKAESLKVVSSRMAKQDRRRWYVVGVKRQVAKHLPGQHDQKNHGRRRPSGNWLDKYPDLPRANDLTYKPGQKVRIPIPDSTDTATGTVTGWTRIDEKHISVILDGTGKTVRLPKTMIAKHGDNTHDEKSHGNWARGTTIDPGEETGRSPTLSSPSQAPPPPPLEQNQLALINQERLALRQPGQPGFEPGVDDNPEIVALAHEKHQVALQREAELTGLLARVAEQTGGRFDGFDERVKYEGSIRGKIPRIQREHLAKDKPVQLSNQEAAEKITDLNRYTLVWDSENYAAGIESAVAALRQQGWDPWLDKSKNAWPAGDAFDGINAKFLDFASDGVVEIQFHTSKSVELKHHSHEMYMEARKVGTPPERVAELQQMMLDLWNTSREHVPPGAEQMFGKPFRYIGKSEIAVSYYVEIDGDDLTYYRVGNQFKVEVLRTDGTWGPSTLIAAELWGLGGDAYFPTTPDQAHQHARALKGDTPQVREMNREINQAIKDVEKHHGPGPHRTGTSQAAHAGDRGRSLLPKQRVTDEIIDAAERADRDFDEWIESDLRTRGEAPSGYYRPSWPRGEIIAHSWTDPETVGRIPVRPGFRPAIAGQRRPLNKTERAVLANLEKTAPGATDWLLDRGINIVFEPQNDFFKLGEFLMDIHSGPSLVVYTTDSIPGSWSFREEAGVEWEGKPYERKYDSSIRTPEAVTDTLLHEIGHAIDWEGGVSPARTMNDKHNKLAGERWTMEAEKSPMAYGGDFDHSSRGKWYKAQPEEVQEKWAYPSGRSWGSSDPGSGFVHEWFAEGVKYYLKDGTTGIPPLDKTIQQGMAEVNFPDPHTVKKAKPSMPTTGGKLLKLLDRYGPFPPEMFEGMSPEEIVAWIEKATWVRKHADHDQKDHGNWARGLSARQRLADIDEPDEGFTRHYPTGTIPTSGFAVALPGHEAKIELDRVTEGWVRQYRKQNAEALARPDTNWGGWVEYDETTGSYVAYLDVSVVTDTLEEAQQIGYQSNQLAVYDIETGETIYLEQPQQRWFQDTPDHDYDAEWDYEIDETPDRLVVDTVGQVSQQIKTDFGGFTTQFVRGLEGDHLGRFANGTGSHPVVVLDAAAIQTAADRYGVPLDVAVRTTIVHELGHAIQELQGEEYSEEGAEAIAADYERKQR